MDALHSTLSGPATKQLMERAFLVFGEARFERLAGISVASLYNLRGGKAYRDTRRHWTKTRPTGVPIGQRRAPQPNGAPGYIRIDRVQQGDQDGVNGVYHITAVDSVTQFQLIATCAKSSEAYLLPVIRQLLEECPFVILGFHADNGSEYVNYRALHKYRYSIDTGEDSPELALDCVGCCETLKSARHIIRPGSEHHGCEFHVTGYGARFSPRR